LPYRRFSGRDDQLAKQYFAYENWLFNAALPLWGGAGVDFEHGGFYEKFDQRGRVVPDVPRRTRVVSRQIYSFAAAGRMGWDGDWAAIVNHGAAALFDRCIREDGLVISTYDEAGRILNADFDFYDHAFALFALAELKRLDEYREQATPVAMKMLGAMEQRFLHPIAGFAEDDRKSVPLRANPHMHFLEACLAHAELDGAPSVWRQWADRIVRMAMSYFIDPEAGGLREFFDYQWQPMPDESGRLIEPGHQFEWSWLLRWWNKRAGDSTVEDAAGKLSSIGETYGVNSKGITIDELWDDFTPRTASARTWPQTERLKACLASAELSRGSSERAIWEQKAAKSLSAFEPFLQTEVSGLWHDRADSTGKPLLAPAPTSTLYHIMCSLEVCQNYLRQDKDEI
jgi:mannose/cellobiose epimerase-like protein (N-acyl-D-glucosamine 2-epimerase family)